MVSSVTKLLPSTVTLVPPELLPDAGEIALTVGLSRLADAGRDDAGPQIAATSAALAMPTYRPAAR